MKRVIKEDRVIFINVPAFMSLWSHHDVINHHFRRYKIKEIERLFDKQKEGNKIFVSYFNFILFLPIYLIRQLSNLFISDEKRPGSGSDFETFKPGIMNTLLYKLMGFESKLLNSNFKLPFGVSILYSWKK